MSAAEKLCVADCVTDCVRLAIPEGTERQRIGNQIDAVMIFARADFISVRWLQPTEWERVTDSLNSRCCRRFRWRLRRRRRRLRFESNVGRIYPPSLSMNGYLLPRCRAARDALGAE